MGRSLRETFPSSQASFKPRRRPSLVYLVGYVEKACLDYACKAYERASGEFAFQEPSLKLINAESTEFKPGMRDQRLTRIGEIAAGFLD